VAEAQEGNTNNEQGTRNDELTNKPIN